MPHFNQPAVGIHFVPLDLPCPGSRLERDSIWG